MTYVLSEEHGELAGAVRQLVQRHPTPSRVRAVVDAGESPFDADVWHRMAGELGLSGLLVPEDDGGSGSGLLEASVVLEEAGALLDAAPLLPAFIATALLAGVDGAEDVRAALAEGARIPAVAWIPALDVSAGGAVDLGGVLFGADADLFVVLTDTAIVVVDAVEGGVRRETARSIDLTRSGARVIVEGAPIRTIPLTEEAADRAAATVSVLVAAELVGVLRGALAQLRDYAAVRAAFGRIIGSFQGVKHQLADIAIAVEIGQTLVRAGVAGLDDGDTADAFAAAWWVADRALAATADTVRLHGGIGYTWEYDAHLWFRRARGDQGLLGPRGRLAARLDDAIGLATA
jgi:alkylation response protein AidB-like acyl-CoA dehydrogenase